MRLKLSEVHSYAVEAGIGGECFIGTKDGLLWTRIAKPGGISNARERLRGNRVGETKLPDAEEYDEMRGRVDTTRTHGDWAKGMPRKDSVLPAEVKPWNEP